MTVALALAPAPVIADPGDGSLDEQIAAAADSLEIVVEQYNDLRERLRASRARADELTAQITPLEQLMAVHRERLGTIAATAYRSNGAQPAAALFAAATADDLVDPLLMLERLGREQEKVLADLAETRHRLGTARRTVRALATEQAVQERQLSARKRKIEGDLLRLGQLRSASGRPGEALLALPTGPPDLPPGAAATAVRFAYAQLGKPYRWAAEGPDGYDCSGLTLAAWAVAGVRLPHNAARQFGAVRRIGRADLRPGDLVFYYRDIHHVAIYVGDGRIIHAPKPGDRVRLDRADYQPVAGYGRPAG
ncbi:C40 family peptidase [Micromonospora sp. NPDC049559]|uniref:C40 family peptidase n=1 Tax=Micromonospora sp. NPDC049559 TaxID=3155923 RepID=UPI003431C4A1